LQESDKRINAPDIQDIDFFGEKEGENHRHGRMPILAGIMWKESGLEKMEIFW
jgi:hypothetical protein